MCRTRFQELLGGVVLRHVHVGDERQDPRHVGILVLKVVHLPWEILSKGSGVHGRFPTAFLAACVQRIGK